MPSFPSLPIRSLLAAALLVLAGCAGLVNRAGNRFAENLTYAILNQDDVATVRDGVPAYLLMVDGFIEADPDNVDMLLAGAKLYGAYGGGLVKDPARGQRLALRSYGYAKRALCLRIAPLCAALDAPFEAFTAALDRVGAKDVGVLYGFTAAWAGKIQTNSADWNAIADVPKVEALLNRVVALDQHYDDGTPYMYLGVLNSLRPASLGGNPEQGRAYFEKALALSGGKNQMVRVLYAEHYARLVFDQELHDRLLHEVLAADPVAPRLTLINILAQRRAKVLLETGKDYF